MLKLCQDPDPHEPHPWITVTDAECSGRAACGEMTHPLHTYKMTTEVRCPGLCGCSFIGKPHGVGEYK